MKGLRHHFPKDRQLTVEPGDRVHALKLVECGVESPKDKDGTNRLFSMGLILRYQGGISSAKTRRSAGGCANFWLQSRRDC